MVRIDKPISKYGLQQVGVADLNGNDLLKRVSSNCLTTGEKNFWRKLTCLECERLQTYPDNYSEGVSKTQRYKMLGNSFTVDVIAAIFRGIIEPHDSTIQHTFDFYGNETTRTHTSIQ